MIFLVNRSKNAYYNMAAEEFFLDRYDGDVFLLWQNQNTIVVGKNQNTLAEINPEYVKQAGITVVRRLTGGGAMYQDPGNLNFTFITDGRAWFSDFFYFAAPVIAALQGLGVPAELSGRNDILVDGRKISGNAQTVHGSRIMHHGTLLFDSNLTVLAHALRPDPEKIAAKGIASVSSRVANISEFLEAPITVDVLIDAIGAAVRARYPDTVVRDITPEEDAAITSLAREKYSTWEWNYGRSPQYTFQNRKRFPAGSVEVKLAVRRGVIEAAAIEGDFFGMEDVGRITHALQGVPHREDALCAALAPFDMQDYFMGIGAEEILALMLP